MGAAAVARQDLRIADRRPALGPAVTRGGSRIDDRAVSEEARSTPSQGEGLAPENAPSARSSAHLSDQSDTLTARGRLNTIPILSVAPLLKFTEVIETSSHPSSPRRVNS